VKNVKPNQMARNGLKFYRVDTVMREKKRAEWNRPDLWPIWVGLIALVLSAVPAVLSYRRRERAPARPA
jgi:peptide/nickel transport system substrate-binding protein